MNPFAQLLANQHLLTALSAMLIAQILKVMFEYWRTSSWKTALFLSPGGMPSSHSALAVAVAASIGIHEGFDTTFFAVSTVVALVVMYDAAGVRRAAGEQAKAINFIFDKLEHRGLKLDTRLKEILGHNPIEVTAGAILGIIVALVASVILS